MLSESQIYKIIERVKKEIEATKYCKNISEISKMTNIPTSTIQRDLNNKELIVELTSLEFYENLQQWLQLAKKFGNITGGKNSQELHGYEKDDKGYFSGISK